MRRLGHKNAKRWWLTRKSVLAVNLVVFGLLVWGFSGEYFRHHRLQAEIVRLQLEADRLESGNFETVKMGQRLADDEAAEREARLKLGLRKPGESVIILKGAGTPSLATDGSKAASVDIDGNVGNFRLWWRYFFEKEKSLSDKQ